LLIDHDIKTIYMEDVFIGVRKVLEKYYSRIVFHSLKLYTSMHTWYMCT